MDLETNQKLFQLITRFVSNNHLLERMDAKLNEFNPFKVLKISHHEIRHSNMLGWLMNPKENHFFRDYFLKKVISEILCGDVMLRNHSLQITDVIMNDFSDAEIYREWRNIDLVIVSKKNNFVLFIENKVYAGLASHQLGKYIQTIKDAYPTVTNIIPVFLTINGDDAPHDEYYSLSHVQILEILKLVLEIHQDHLSSKIYDFVNYYIQTLEELTMQDEQLIALCREVYKQHRDAIDAIVKYGMVSNSNYHEAIEIIKDSNTLDIVDYSTEPRLFKNEKEIWFVPSRIKQKLPTLTRKWKSPFPISFFFVKEENKLRLILEVGPISDGQIRLNLLNQFVNQNSTLFTVKGAALTNINGSYTKIRTESVDITDWDDIDYLTERIQHLLVKKFKYDEVNQALESLISNFDDFVAGKEI